MSTRLTSILIQLLALLLSGSLGFAQQERALERQTPQGQETPIQYTSTPQDNISRQSPPTFPQQELDQMLAPIALYPDSLLSQILMAATYPLEVVEAARWSKANSNLEGEHAVQAVAQKAWDPSVKSLVAFPQILLMMDEKLTWMERLGEAFLTQQPLVMDTVQDLRQKASAAGNLSSNDQIQVDQQGQTIIIEPTNPQLVYVPYYNPMVMYGLWWWPTYQPVYWNPWPGYFRGSRFGVGFTWGRAISVGPRFFFGAFNWRNRHVSVVNVHNFYYRPGKVNRRTVWAHNPIHRRGVQYRNPALRQQFGHLRGSSKVRGRFGNRPAIRGGSPGHFTAPGGNRPALRGLRSRPNIPRGFGNRPGIRGNSPGRFIAPGGNRPALRGLRSRPNIPRGFGNRLESRGGFHNRPGIRGGKGFPSRSFGGFQGKAGRSHRRR
jgi:hypothetical protein